MKQSRLHLSSIRTECGTQIRESICEDTVSEYAERMTEGDEFPPIIVFHDGNEHYLADGFHRVMAASRVGYREIDAFIHKGTFTDAKWFALGANKKNGRRLTAGDLKKAIILALTDFPDKTQQAIADQVGCAQSYVTRIKSELITSDKLEMPDRIVGKDGKSRPASYKPRRPTTPEEEEAMYLDEKPQPTRKEDKKKLGPPCDGMQFARMAVMDLEQIKHNDAERKQAFSYVTKWIKENEKD
jgi:ParB-like chromosome segregation protein Spo0J